MTRARFTDESSELLDAAETSALPPDDVVTVSAHTESGWKIYRFCRRNLYDALRVIFQQCQRGEFGYERARVIGQLVKVAAAHAGRDSE